MNECEARWCLQGGVRAMGAMRQYAKDIGDHRCRDVSVDDIIRCD